MEERHVAEKEDLVDEQNVREEYQVKKDNERNPGCVSPDNLTNRPPGMGLFGALFVRAGVIYFVYDGRDHVI